MEESVSEPLVEQIEHRDVRELQMNRPPVNALTGEFLAQLRAAIERVTREEAKRIVLSGLPGRFSPPVSRSSVFEALGGATRG
jgi:enoyl-CoA hydratase/carnithine racemase